MKSPANRWMIATVALATVFVLGLIGLFTAAPLLSLVRMGNAARNRDVKTFVSYIDFPRVRENLKADLNAQMLEKMTKDPEKNSIGTGFAAMLGPTVINNMIDAYVTPASVERMLRKDFKLSPDSAATPPITFVPEDDGEWDYAYTGVSEFKLVVSKPKQTPVAFTMERENLIFWKLVRIQMLD